MRAMVGKVGLVAMAFAATSAVARDAEFEATMEVQRCIWSCLANSAGAENTDYFACVAQVCNGASAEPGGPSSPAAGQPQGSWTTGQGGDGRPYAAVTGPGVDGEAGIYVQCGGGRGSLAIGGFDGGNNDMGLVISGSTFPVPAGPSGYPEVALTTSSSLYAALIGGSSVGVILSDGRTVVTYSLRGSSAALAALGGGC